MSIQVQTVISNLDPNRPDTSEHDHKLNKAIPSNMTIVDADVELIPSTVRGSGTIPSKIPVLQIRTTLTLSPRRILTPSWATRICTIVDSLSPENPDLTAHNNKTNSVPGAVNTTVTQKQMKVIRSGRSIPVEEDRLFIVTTVTRR